MKLRRNQTADGSCKYAAVRNDKIERLNEAAKAEARAALTLLTCLGVLENPKKGDPEEFLLIKLKDINAPSAFIGYATAALTTDIELSADVAELAIRAVRHPHRKRPD